MFVWAAAGIMKVAGPHVLSRLAQAYSYAGGWWPQGFQEQQERICPNTQVSD